MGAAAEALFSKDYAVAATTWTFDLETIPDLARANEFDLDPIEPIIETPVEQLPSPEAIVEGSAEQVKERLKSICGPQEWYRYVIQAEEEGKARVTVFKTLHAEKLKRQSRIEEIDDRRKLLSTTPEYCSVVAMGYAIGSEKPKSLVVGQEKNGKLVTERYILSAFWHLASRFRQVIGYNIINFDLPVVFFRSAHLDVEPSRVFDVRPWGTDVIDLFLKRFPKFVGKDRPAKLKELAKLSGIEVPAGDVDGSQVEQLYREEPQKLARYVESDVAITRQLYDFMKGYYF